MSADSNDVYYDTATDPKIAHAKREGYYWPEHMPFCYRCAWHAYHIRGWQRARRNADKYGSREYKDRAARGAVSRLKRHMAQKRHDQDAEMYRRNLESWEEYRAGNH